MKFNILRENNFENFQWHRKIKIGYLRWKIFLKSIRIAKQILLIRTARIT